MREVAVKAGVSKNAVSLAFRAHPSIPADTRDHILKTAGLLGYRKNATVAHLMSVLRAERKRDFQATLAVLNANRNKDALTKHPTIPAYMEGIRRAAWREGYALDEFWLHDPGLDGKRLGRILGARGIRGGIVVGLMNSSFLPEKLAPLWSQLPFVVTGVRTLNPALPGVFADHHDLVRQAFHKALELGYKRPGLVLDGKINSLVDFRFGGGYLTAQSALAARRRVPAFYEVQEARKQPEIFIAWLERYQPDVLLTLYAITQRWVKTAGLRVPDDIGLIQLEWRMKEKHWAGMNQHNDLTGETAVENLIALIHRNAISLPAPAHSTIIKASWVDGNTVRETNGITLREPPL